MDTFWGHSSTFWTGVGAIGECVYTALVIVTLWFIYRQMRIGAKAFQLEAICRLQGLVDDFEQDRDMLFRTCPAELALSQEQFSNRPPGRHTARRLNEDQIRKMALTPQQSMALHSISNEIRTRATHVIERLNDIGQLVEDGFIDRRCFLGKYHVMVIQCCHVVEAIRRDEEAQRGGNYGQRLLRMRRWATVYNDVWPKHRNSPIYVTAASGRHVVYESPSPTMIRRCQWIVRRSVSWY